MTEIDLPYFGRIELDPLREIYDANVVLDGMPSEIWLEFFEERTAKGADWQVVLVFLGQIERHANTARRTLRTALGQEELASYRNHHISEGVLPRETDLNALQRVMKLRKVGIRPKPGRDEFATFDFTLPDDVTNQLMVVRLTGAGEAVSVDMES
ncbi:MAG: DUF2004 domain-containing protein [Pseudomonadota bacterium]